MTELEIRRERHAAAAAGAAHVALFASEPPADADFLAERPAVIESGRFDLSDGGGAAPTESGR